MNHELVLQLMYAYFYFMIYAFAGWIVQGIFVGYKEHRFLNTGFYHGPYVPIFGVGCLLIIYIIDPISMNPFCVFVNTFVITSVLEYATSWYLQKKYHRLWWDYSKKPFNIHGRACLLNSTLYGIAGLVVTFVFQPWIRYWTMRIPFAWLLGIEAVYSVAFWSDVIITTMEMHAHVHALEDLHLHIQKALKEENEKLRTQYVEQAKKSFEQMKATSRHLKGFISQELEERYKQSIASFHSLTKHKTTSH